VLPATAIAAALQKCGCRICQYTFCRLSQYSTVSPLLNCLVLPSTSLHLKLCESVFALKCFLPGSFSLLLVFLYQSDVPSCKGLLLSSCFCSLPLYPHWSSCHAMPEAACSAPGVVTAALCTRMQLSVEICALFLCLHFPMFCLLS